MTADTPTPAGSVEPTPEEVAQETALCVADCAARERHNLGIYREVEEYTAQLVLAAIRREREAADARVEEARHEGIRSGRMKRRIDSCVCVLEDDGETIAKRADGTLRLCGAHQALIRRPRGPSPQGDGGGVRALVRGTKHREVGRPA